ncbi:ECF transporter S component [Corynebacterium sp. TA-R-1]|uniref:ECF transporter S component n=1 Tax=Corynebacterium stercoris TaxID=2943490 RepID=A0ABT1G030_9CORY|nr:ECF transporter S component [Corynebacterium stercoris]MCP1387368.1 ECF transporter S component [Corynebacterium stercoris]
MSTATTTPAGQPARGAEWTPARRGLVIAGAAVIAATWLYLVLVRPADWENVTGSTQGIITLLGYGIGTILLLIATVPVLPARTLGLIPIAMIINSVVGEIVGSSGLPLYLDSVGTVLVAALAGPVAGMTTGALNNVVWGLLNPAALPFAAGAALIGWLSGEFIHRFHAFKNIGTVIIYGLLLGVVGGMVAAPVAAFVYGGTAGVGTGALVSLFREMGGSLIASVTTQAFISDPVDKLIVMLVAFFTVKALPKRTVDAFAPREGQGSAGATAATV